MAESAIIVRVLEAEPLVGRLREEFDSSAGLGVPAHITVLTPFMPPERISDAIVQQLRSSISRIRPIEFRLGTVGRFPGVLYLAPEPSGPFVELIARLVREFPEYPPYGGEFQHIVPHLTVADGGESQVAEARLLDLIRERGPVLATCEGLRIIENSAGRWREMCQLPFGGGEVRKS